MWVHWLTPGNYNSPNEILFSNLASVRMRIGLVAKYVSNLNINFSAGDIVPVGVDVIVIGKIGSDCKSGREELWYKQIIEATKLSKIIILDYTDHHMGNKKSPMFNFYASVINFSDYVIVPSAGMKDNIEGYYSGSVEIIEDPIEIEINYRNQIIKPVKPKLLWFGHGSNAQYLIDYLNNGDLCDMSIDIYCLTNPYGINLISNSDAAKKNYINLIFSEWSLINMTESVKFCDACIIPSDVNSPFKSGASSNRLITAFALGLPVSASSLKSYIPYSDYYHDLNSSSLSEFIGDIEFYHDCTIRSQKNIVPNYVQWNIFLKWKNLFEKMVLK